MAEGGFEMDDAAAFGAADDDLDDALDDADALDYASDDNADEETSFIDPVPIGAERAVGGAPQKQRVLKAAVDDYYDLCQGWTNTTRQRYHKFRAWRW